MSVCATPGGAPSFCTTWARSVMGRTSTTGTPCDAATAEAACAPGTYSGSGASACDACDRGSFTADAGRASCSLAGAGFAVAEPGASAEAPCPAGTYSAAGATDCAACAAGFFSEAEHATACVVAPAGSFVASAGASEATPCPTGSASGAAATECEIATHSERPTPPRHSAIARA